MKKPLLLGTEAILERNVERGLLVFYRLERCLSYSWWHRGSRLGADADRYSTDT